MEQDSVLCQFSWTAEERYRLENQRKGETSGVNKSEARFLPNCFVGNWEGIRTVQLHSSGASYAGCAISPTLKRLHRAIQVKLYFITPQKLGIQPATFIASHQYQPYARQKSLS